MKKGITEKHGSERESSQYFVRRIPPRDKVMNSETVVVFIREKGED